jgi:hypothetical protein
MEQLSPPEATSTVSAISPPGTRSGLPSRYCPQVRSAVGSGRGSACVFRRRHRR